jgi:Polyketide cyclase / dehydrase and lipid transport
MNVRVAQTFPGTVPAAERRWYDTAGWASWMDGLARVLSTSPDWPAAGAVVVWESGPAGRGRVRERVVSYEPLSGQTVEVHDDSIDGRQSVSFQAVEEGVRVELELDYRIRRRSIVTPLVDRLFVRRPMASSLQTTLARFGARLATRSP